MIILNENAWDKIALLKREMLDLVEMLATDQIIDREVLTANLIRNLRTLQIIEENYIQCLQEVNVSAYEKGKKEKRPY